MNPMVPQKGSVNLYDLHYPVYVSPIPPNSQVIVHVPGHFEYKHLDNVFTHIVEGYKTNDKIYLYDCIPYALWYKQVCHVSYEKRLKSLRDVVYKDIENSEHVVELDCVLIDNPMELFDYCDNLLTQKYTKVRITDGSANYVFGPCFKGECLEVDL